MDYIYGSLNEDVEQVEYYGVNTDTANIDIEQEDRTISVNVKKVPNTLTITSGTDEIVYDGSSSKSINIDSGSDYSAGEGITISDNTISIDSETVATKNDLTSKQDTLESGVTIKTINNESILGEGNIEVGGKTIYAHDVKCYSSVANSSKCNASFKLLNNSSSDLDTISKVASELYSLGFTSSSSSISACGMVYYSSALYIVSRVYSSNGTTIMFSGERGLNSGLEVSSTTLSMSDSGITDKVTTL